VPFSHEDCDCSRKATRVAHGRSPGGLPWEITAVASGKGGLLHFDLLKPAFPDAGWSAGVPGKLAKGFFFVAVGGSGLGPTREADLSGYTRKSVRTLRVTMQDGTVLDISPALVPKKARKRHPWLRKLRVFDRFFPDTLNPVSASALDSSGAVLQTKTVNRGSFF